MDIRLYISSAGIAGDPYKLLVIDSDVISTHELFDSDSFLNISFWCAVFKLIKKYKNECKLR